MALRKLKRIDPDKMAGSDNPSDYTGSDAVPDRVLRINLGFFKYGTNDKTQGAAIFFSLLLLILIFLTIILQCFFPIIDKFLPWLQSTFILIIGIALGRSSKGTT